MMNVGTTLTLDQSTTYQIKVPGELDASWSDWAGGMTITVECEGDGLPVTILSGTVVDQAALQGLLRRLYSLGLPLISVIWVENTGSHSMQAKQVFSAYSAQGSDDLLHFKYCPFCGTELELKDKGGKQRPACPNCRFVQFKNPSPGAVVLIERDGCVLLGRRSGSYGAGKWCLPMGFIEYDEDFMSAAIREVREETGLDVEICSILSVVSNFLSPRLHTLAIVLLARVVGGELHAGDDLEVVEWVPLSEPLPEMAFEADAHICERYHRTRLEGAPVDPGYAVAEQLNKH